MVEAAESEAVEAGVDVEGGEGGADRVQIEVAEGDVLALGGVNLVLGQERHAHALNVVEVVVERLRRLGGGAGGEAGFEVGLQGPVAGAAAGGDAGEHDGAALVGGGADAAGGDLGGGGHDHLEGVLDRLGGVKEEDVLGAGAHIDGEDAHHARYDSIGVHRMFTLADVARGRGRSLYSVDIIR